MDTKYLTPILNVTSIENTIRWFEMLGWKTSFTWGEPTSFGGVVNGDVEIFMCLNGQGGRGKGKNTGTFGPQGDESADKGVWMSLWVDSVDDVHSQCIDNRIEVTFEPTDMPWNVREMQIRHPDGHVFRVSYAIERD